MPITVLLGSRVGAVVRALASHQCVPGLIPGLNIICWLSLLVLFSALRGFSPGTLVFPSPQKPTVPIFNLIQMQNLPENGFGEWSFLDKYYDLHILY